MQRTKLVYVLGACVAFFVSCSDSTNPSSSVFYSAILNGASEKPTATTSTAVGTFSASISAGDTLTYFINWVGLTGTQTGAHIHGPADANSIANILVDFSALPTVTTVDTVILATGGTFVSGTSGSAGGKIRLTKPITSTVSGDSLRKLLDAGLLYVNVHTAANPGGEIRGQVTKQ